MEIIDKFTTKQTKGILGVEDRPLRYWDSLQLFTPEKNHIGKPGKRKEYTFRMIVEAGVVREFDKNNMAVTLARKAVAALKKYDFNCLSLDAYNTLQSFLDKLIPPNELYQEKFLNGLKDAVTDVKSKNYSEVKSFEEFIS